MGTSELIANFCWTSTDGFAACIANAADSCDCASADCADAADAEAAEAEITKATCANLLSEHIIGESQVSVFLPLLHPPTPCGPI